MKKEIFNEIFWLRSIACLGVALFHSIQYTTVSVNITEIESYALIVARLALLYGTPTFVFISEFLLARNYTNGLPKGFFTKRVKYLLIPYIFIGTFSAVIHSSNHNPQVLLIEILKNVFLGDFVGYFVLIIFQFYILHMLLHKVLIKWSWKIILPISFIINAAYLAFFTFVEPLNVPYAEYIWYKLHWIPFYGWLFYFSLGYYIGKNYNLIKKSFTELNKLNILIPFLISFLTLVTLTALKLPYEVSSKRIDVILYTTCTIITILYFTSKLNNVPKFLYLISRYSFSIYLLHTIFLAFLTPEIDLNPFLYAIIAFIMSIILSISAAYIINKIPYGKYLVGKINNKNIIKSKTNPLVKTGSD